MLNIYSAKCHNNKIVCVFSRCVFSYNFFLLIVKCIVKCLQNDFVTRGIFSAEIPLSCARRRFQCPISSGFLVEQIWTLLSGVVSDFRTIAIHVGTNNIPNEDYSIILHRYRYLLKSTWNAKLSARSSHPEFYPATSTVWKERITTLDLLTQCLCVRCAL